MKAAILALMALGMAGCGDSPVRPSVDLATSSDPNAAYIRTHDCHIESTFPLGKHVEQGVEIVSRAFDIYDCKGISSQVWVYQEKP